MYMAVISNNIIMEQKNSELISACYCTLICIVHNLDYNDNVFRWSAHKINAIIRSLYCNTTCVTGPYCA